MAGYAAEDGRLSVTANCDVTGDGLTVQDVVNVASGEATG